MDTGIFVCDFPCDNIVKQMEAEKLGREDINVGKTIG